MRKIQKEKGTPSRDECIPEKKNTPKMMIYYIKNHWTSLLFLIPIMVYCRWIINYVKELDSQLLLYFVVFIGGFFIIGLFIYRKEEKMKKRNLIK
ncbi:MAG: O-antigen/teichoic acid export membrane protein [Crocinitomicaceae bacterium]|jgi:O-antigen/teichoic acid export membrane protein